jgi:hypothetical protein
MLQEGTMGIADTEFHNDNQPGVLKAATSGGGLQILIFCPVILNQMTATRSSLNLSHNVRFK